MKANEYAVMGRAVEEGVALGVRRADKYADDPLTDAQQERVIEAVTQAVETAICEWFVFDDPPA